jgi:hypothetical protein
MAEEALSFEKVWAALMETRERQEETARGLKESKRIVDALSANIGGLNNRCGELVEHLVAPGIMEKFRELNYKFVKVGKNIEIHDSSGKCIVEVDLLLENGDAVMAVEVKSKPDIEDVKAHVERMEILRRHADAVNDKRKYHGAIAAAVMSSPVREYAHKTGFYVIEQTGDTMKINIPEGFVAGEW